jgi:hypothetical protein
MASWLDSIGQFILPSAEASPQLAYAGRKYLGQGEQGGNNAGPFVENTLGAPKGSPWCSYFVSKAAKDAGENYFGTLPRAADWLTKGQQEGWKVSKPQVGDISIWSRDGGNHTGFVNRITDKGFYSIEGNTGEYPSKVKELFHPFKEGNFKGFVRTPPNPKYTEEIIRKDPAIQAWWKRLPESKTMDIIDFVNLQKKQQIYDYWKAVQNLQLPSYQKEHDQYRWSDIGKMSNNPNLNNLH